MRELTREQVEYAVGRLVRLVESRGIKQTQLEQTSEVNQSTISKIFSGWQEPGADKYTPSEEVLTKLFSAIGRESAASDPRSPIRHEPDTGRQEARNLASFGVSPD